MDKDRKRQLKAAGKREVARQSEALRAAMKQANPADYADPAWAANHKRATELGRRLRLQRPIIHRTELERDFVIWEERPYSGPSPETYVRCGICGSAVPSQLARKLFYWNGCACGNIKYRMILWWRRTSVRDTSALSEIRLVGRGDAKPGGPGEP